MWCTCQLEKRRLELGTRWLQIPALPLTGCATLGKLLALSESQFLHLSVSCLTEPS